MTTDPTAPKAASEFTRAANAAVLDMLPFEDERDFERATRGHIATGPDTVTTPEGWPVWDPSTFAFVAGDAPDTVNPSLWRQAKLNQVRGLFRVTDRVYQVRGFDLSNITFVEGDTSWIVIDPLTAAETARAAYDLVTEHLGHRPIAAVIYTHSHVDHFGGVRGIVDEADVTAGRVQIVAPDGFLAAAISENVVAGNVMTRRATYMYGALLPRGPRGHVDSGLGQTVPLGTQGLLAPTDSIVQTGEERTIDGVRIVFQVTPGTEAPAEMNFHFPDLRALCMAENCSGTFHNVYTPRGAEVRDALAWSKYIGEAIGLFLDGTDVVFASHHWPRFGRDDGRAFLECQRDLYRFVHDQTLRLANHGYTPLEIAEMLELPRELATEFFNRDYYGTLNHNVKAVYQKYLGWFDGNPANLHPLPPTEAGARYVEYMGGADALLARARESFARGEYRWVAQVVNHLVFADPDNRAARVLQADALEQLGYQAESGPWRAFYLTGAQELRHGVPEGMPALGAMRPDVMGAMTSEQVLDFLGVRLDGPAAAGRVLRFDLRLTDRAERFTLTVERGALHAERDRAPRGADATVTLSGEALVLLAAGAASLAEELEMGDVVIEGDRAAFEEFLALLDRFDFWFDIVIP